MKWPTGQTRRRIFTLDGSNDADSRKNVPFLGVSLTLLPILGVKYPQNPNFWGVNRRFQAKRAKYWKFHVIETNMSILTKFCTTIETTKNSSWVVSIGAQQIQDGGRPPFWKTVKSLYLCNRLTDFDKIWYSDAYWQKSLKRSYYLASHWHSGDVMVGNITFLMIFAVFDPSPLTRWINCSFSINFRIITGYIVFE